AHLAVRCQGNVLFLRELVLGALHDGSLCDDGGIWRLVSPLLPSERLIELVEARLGRLDGAERRLLELVSFGEPLGPAELRAVADPEVVEALEWKGLLVSRRDGHRAEVRLGHPLYGDVLRSRVSALRVPEIARSLAEAVEAMGARRREDTLRVATWRLQGGGAQPDRMLAAATTARWRYDFPLAERLATAAIDAGAGFEAEFLAAQLACLQGRSEEADGRLRVLAGKATDDAQRGAVAMPPIWPSPSRWTGIRGSTPGSAARRWPGAAGSRRRRRWPCGTTSRGWPSARPRRRPSSAGTSPPWWGSGDGCRRPPGTPGRG